ncbi:hypothetical protein H7J86_24565 [Mycobacterium hackensackense]|uniref:hypothetical protein n=1 Tax=Mycobacterium hackensackense TaxID=228909 RepID=UPI0022658641|nr:hypothetical protein [Mycobacterium hackensackense]MCV7255341.1 hypothetical protein [Mycobacterium hackensackense]
MAQYTIVKECAFTQDGKGVHHTEPGAVVELDEATAAELGDAVEVVDDDDDVMGFDPAPDPDPKTEDKSPAKTHAGGTGGGAQKPAGTSGKPEGDVDK